MILRPKIFNDEKKNAVVKCEIKIRGTAEFKYGGEPNGHDSVFKLPVASAEESREKKKKTLKHDLAVRYDKMKQF